MEFAFIFGLYFHPEEIWKLFGGEWTLLSALPTGGEKWGASRGSFASYWQHDRSVVAPAEVAADGGEIVAFEIEEAPGDFEGVIPEVGLRRDAKSAGEEFSGGKFGDWLDVIWYWGGVEEDEAEGRMMNDEECGRDSHTP